MICSNCGQPSAYITRRSKAYGSGDSLIVVENVPVISCRECGTDFLSITTLGQIDQLRAIKADVPMRLVPVATFQDVADPVLDDLAALASA